MSEPETIDVCSHGRPDHQELIRQLLDALGLGTHARPQTPQAVFEECLAEIERLRHPRVGFQPENPPRTVLGVPWCGRCGESLYSHDCSPPASSDTPPQSPESPSEVPPAPGQPEDGSGPQEPPVRRVAISICQPCLDGEGDECHTPGCALYMHRVDLRIDPVFYEVLDP